MAFDPDSIYPKPVKPSNTYWIVRTMIDDGSNTVLAYTPLVVQEHPDKAKAEEFMREKVAAVKPKEVKIIGGPFGPTEAFMWTTLNPYVYATEASANTPAKNGHSQGSTGTPDGTDSSKTQYKPNSTGKPGDPGYDPWADDPNAS